MVIAPWTTPPTMRSARYPVAQVLGLAVHVACAVGVPGMARSATVCATHSVPNPVDVLRVGVRPVPAKTASEVVAPWVAVPLPDTSRQRCVVPAGAGIASCRLVTEWTSWVPGAVVVTVGRVVVPPVPAAAPQAWIGVAVLTPL